MTNTDRWGTPSNWGSVSKSVTTPWLSLAFCSAVGFSPSKILETNLDAVPGFFFGLPTSFGLPVIIKSVITLTEVMPFNFLRADTVRISSIVVGLTESIIWSTSLASPIHFSYCFAVVGPTPFLIASCFFSMPCLTALLNPVIAFFLLATGKDDMLSPRTLTTASLLRIEAWPILTIAIGTNPLYWGLSFHHCVKYSLFSL